MLEIINTVVVLRIKIADSLHSDMGPTIARKAPDCQTHVEPLPTIFGFCRF